jgi:hypothetical protein
MFDWDEFNAGHIARHGITPQEVEQVLRNDPADGDRRMWMGKSEPSMLERLMRCACSSSSLQLEEN